MSEEQLPQENPNPQEESKAVPFPPPNGGFNPQNPGMGGGYQMPVALPNATLVLVLGIVSIVSCCCFYGIISLASAIVALVLSKKDRALYFASPGVYTEGSYKNLNAGRVCAIVGLILAGLIIILCIGFVLAFGLDVLTNQGKLLEHLKSFQQ